MNTIKELKLTLQIPLTIKIRYLQAEHEQKYVNKQIAQPGNCDNEFTETENRAWFSAMWQQQIRFQQALIDNPDYLTSFLRHVVLEKINTPLYFSDQTPFLPSSDIEMIAEPIVTDLDAEDHFFPAASLGVDTSTMLSDLLESTDVCLSGPPVLVTRN